MSDLMFENVELVQLGFEIWSGERKLERGDLGANLEPDLPDEKVVSLGRKKLINTIKYLRPLNSLRSKASNLLDREGIRFMGGYAVPEDAINRVSLQLQSICDEFNVELDRFLDDYDRIVDEWVGENPDFGANILAAKLPVGIVRSRCTAEFAIYRVSSSRRDTSNSLDKQGDTLEGKILEDAHKCLMPYITKIDEAAMDGRNSTFRVTIRSSIRAIAEKIRRFSFADRTGGFIPFAALLEDAVAGTGKVDDGDFRQLAKVLGGLGSYHAFYRKVVSLSGHQPLPPRVPDLLTSTPPAPAPVAAPDPVSQPAPDVGVPSAAPEPMSPVVSELIAEDDPQPADQNDAAEPEALPSPAADAREPAAYQPYRMGEPVSDPAPADVRSGASAGDATDDIQPDAAPQAASEPVPPAAPVASVPDRTAVEPDAPARRVPISLNW